jgi:HPt (histidine-containing phosphotransfer) domain-containing protein
MTQPLFDSSAFLTSLADDRELAEELLSAFLEDSPVRHESLGRALDDDDGDEASKLAHSLKGMCGVVRAEKLVTLALNMEHAAKEGDLALTRELYAQFTETLAAVSQEIKRFMEQG